MIAMAASAEGLARAGAWNIAGHVRWMHINEAGRGARTGALARGWR